MNREENIFLVYPYGLWNNYYIKFYNKFLEKYVFPNKINFKIDIIVINEKAKEHIDNLFEGMDYEIFIIKDAVDIWIRDWAPLVCRGKAIKTNYYPYYAGKICKKISLPLNNAGKELVNISELECKEIHLLLDGGNFIFNNDTAILTERILKDNKYYSESQIKDILQESLELKKILFIPEEPGDVTGHIDGMVRFIDDKIVVGEYPAEYKEGKIFMNNIVELIAKELESKYKIIRLINETPIDLHKNVSMPSAIGNHINFLKAGTKIFFPDYKLKTDDIANDTLCKYFPDYDIIRVDCDELKKLANEGGALNCITWQY